METMSHMAVGARVSPSSPSHSQLPCGPLDRYCVSKTTRVNSSCRSASREPVNTSQTVSCICDRALNGTDSDLSSIIPIQNKEGYITPQQVYNLLSAEEGQPALYDPYYILILDCRSTERYEDSHVVTARAAVTVIHSARLSHQLYRAAEVFCNPAVCRGWVQPSAG
ncbi:hypothetical protein NQZ68_003124 [Dissostichus eleginoides]|nr:hypothetical protein NQZ68_003124 [Dissostichus eleginoides]